MVTMLGRASINNRALRRSPVRSVGSAQLHRLTALVARTSKDDAVKQLEQFGASVAAKVQESAPQDTVPVLPLVRVVGMCYSVPGIVSQLLLFIMDFQVSRSIDGSTSGSIDGEQSM